MREVGISGIRNEGKRIRKAACIPVCADAQITTAGLKRLHIERIQLACHPRSYAQGICEWECREELAYLAGIQGARA